MTVTIKLAPVMESITVDAPIDKAFKDLHGRNRALVAGRLSIGKSPIKNVIVEPRTGGRWYEVGEDGSECDWGDVLNGKRRRACAAWRIRPDWGYDPDLFSDPEIHIRFAALGENATRSISNTGSSKTWATARKRCAKPSTPSPAGARFFAE